MLVIARTKVASALLNLNGMQTDSCKTFIIYKHESSGRTKNCQ